MVLQNYVILQPDKPARMHFTDHQIIVKTITDPVTGRGKQVNTLVFSVDELEGRPVVASYSVISQKHSADFAPYLPVRAYRDYDFIITVSGEYWQREYQTQAVFRGRK